MSNTTTDKSNRSERIRDGVFEQDGYNANIDLPVDVEPVPKDAPGAALDVRDMPEDGVVEIHDDDEDVLEEERQTPISR